MTLVKSELQVIPILNYDNNKYNILNIELIPLK